VTEFVVLLIAAIAVFGFAVWFGRHVIAPRIERALDRAESKDGDGDGND
jgi:hypothetical protein